MMIIVKAMCFDDDMKGYIMNCSIIFKIKFPSSNFYSLMGFANEAEARNFFKNNVEIPQITQYEGSLK